MPNSFTKRQNKDREKEGKIKIEKKKPWWMYDKSKWESRVYRKEEGKRGCAREREGERKGIKEKNY